MTPTGVAADRRRAGGGAGLLSTAAVFGDPEYVPIDEAHPQAPIIPYGHSKLMVEQILGDFDAA